MFIVLTNIIQRWGNVCYVEVWVRGELKAGRVDLSVDIVTSSTNCLNRRVLGTSLVSCEWIERTWSSWLQIFPCFNLQFFCKPMFPDQDLQACIIEVSIQPCLFWWICDPRMTATGQFSRHAMTHLRPASGARAIALCGFQLELMCISTYAEAGIPYSSCRRLPSSVSASHHNSLCGNQTHVLFDATRHVFR